MKDFSIERGVKELRGNFGTFEFRADGDFWKVYEKVDDAFLYRCNLPKRSETNKELYARTVDAARYDFWKVYDEEDY